MIDQSKVISITPSNEYAALYELLIKFNSNDLSKWAKKYNATFLYTNHSSYAYQDYEFLLFFLDKESFVQFVFTWL